MRTSVKSILAAALVAIGFGFSTVASAAEKEICVLVTHGTDKGIGFGNLSPEAYKLIVKLHSQGGIGINITSSERYDASGEHLWMPGSISTPGECHVYHVCGVMPNDAHAVKFKGYLTPLGGGGGGDPGPGGPGGPGGGSGSGSGGTPVPDFKVAVSDIDVDVDSDNDSLEIYRPPSGNETEDGDEWLADVGGSIPPGLKMFKGEDWAQIKVRANVKKAGYFRLTAAAEDAIRFEFADENFDVLSSGGTVFSTVLNVAVVEGLLERTLYVKPLDTANELDTMTLTGIIETSEMALYRAEDKLLITVEGHEDLDTNNDEICYAAYDLDSFGADTGSMTFEVERPEAQVFLPLAVSQWNFLPIHAYVTDGGFHHRRNRYWNPENATGGIWQAYSLHTRVTANKVQTPASMSETPPHDKIVEIIRPRGNLVRFKFAWDPGLGESGGFKPLGYPQGINLRRTYVLRDITPESDTDRDYDLMFESGIVHEFRGENGLLSHVRHIDGRKLPVDGSLIAFELSETTPPVAVQGPRYTVELVWSSGTGLLDKVEYTDRVSSKIVETDVTLSEDEKRVKSFIKYAESENTEKFADLSAALNEGLDEITYGNGEKYSRTPQDPGQNTVITLTRKLPDIGTSPAEEWVKTAVTRVADFTTQTEVYSSTNGGTGETPVKAKTTYKYLNTGDDDYETGDDRYANGAPKWGKVKEIIDPEFKWTRLKFDSTRGWTTRMITPFKGSTNPEDGGDEDDHEVVELDYATVGSGNAKDDTMLTERPRTRLRKVLGIEVEKTLFKYTDISEGDSGVTTTQQVRVRGAGWDSSPDEDADSNLQTVMTRKTTGPSDVDSPTMDSEYTATVNEAETKLTLVATSKGPTGSTISVTTTLENAFGMTESSVTTESSITTASAVSTLDTTFGFGRLKKTTYLADSLFDEVVTHTYRGPTEVIGKDGSKTVNVYTAACWLRSAEQFPDQTDSTKSIKSTSYFDALGNTIQSVRLGEKTDFDNITTETTAVFDILSRQTSATNEMSKTTGYAHLPAIGTAPEGGVRSLVTTQPDGHKSKVEMYLEGRQKEQVIDGDHKVGYATVYDYGVDEGGMDDAGGFWSKTTRNSDNDWTQSWQNHVGQTYRQARSGATNKALTYFDELGRQKKHKGFDNVVQIQNYDARNEVGEVFTDEDNDATHDSEERRTTYGHTVSSSPDRRVRTTTVHALSAGDDQVTVSETYFASHESMTKVKSGMTEGMSPEPVWQTTHTQTIYAGSGGWVTTTTYPDQSKTMASYAQGEIEASTDFDKEDVEIREVTYVADPLGRGSTMTDRRGTTKYTYNLAGQLNKTELPDERTEEIQARDDMLRPTQIKRLDNKLVNRTYNPNGDPHETEGAGVYDNNKKDEVARPLPTQLTTTAGAAGEGRTRVSYHEDAPLPKDKKLGVEEGETGGLLVSSRSYLETSLQLDKDARPGVDIKRLWSSTTGEMTHLKYFATGETTDPLINYKLEYDANRRLKKFGPDGSQVQRAYTPGDQLELETVPHISGFEVRYGYDDNNRRKSLKLMTGETPLLEYTYVYDPDTGLFRGIKVGDDDTGTWVYQQTYQENSFLPKDIKFRAAGFDEEDGSGAADLTVERTFESTTNRHSRVKAFTGAATLFQADYTYNSLDQRTGADLTVKRVATGSTDTVKWHYASDGETPPTGGGSAAATAILNIPLSDNWTGADDDPWKARWQFEEYSATGGQTREAELDTNRGKLTFTTNSETAEVISYLTISPAKDIDVKVQFEVDDATERFGLVARGEFAGDDEFGNGADDTYLVADVGNGQIRLRRVDAGSSSNLVSAGSYTLTPATKYWLRMWVETAGSNTNVKVKVWADSAPEPAAWSLAATDSGTQLEAGCMGLYFMAPSTVATAVIEVDEFSATVGDIPGVPGLMYATGVSESRIDLTWTDDSNYESGYAIERSSDGSTGWAHIGASGEGVINYADGGHDPDTTKYYRARPYNNTIRADAWTASNGNPWSPRWQFEEYSATGGQTRTPTVQSNRGQLSFTTNSEAAEIVAYQTVSRAQDAEVFVQFELSDTTERFGVVAQGAFGSATAFGSGTADTYLVADVGNSQLRLRRVDAGSSSNLASPDSVSLSASTKYWLRVSVSTVSSQAVVKAKVWEDGDPEPGAWDLEATDTGGSQFAAGSLGLYFMAPSTVASPVITVDALTATVYGTYTSNDSATTIDIPDVLEVPKDHLAVALMKNGSNARPGMFYSYGYDGIGNRLSAHQRSGHGHETHTPNILNQTTKRGNPGVVHVSGFAAETATVLVNDRPALRDGEYYYATVTVDNSAGPVVAETTVTIITKSADGDSVSQSTVKTLVSKAVEDDELSYHDRGNFLTGSLFDYDWDAKDRLTSVITNDSITDDEVKVKVTFEYDAFDRRTKKKVYVWDPEEGESGDWVLEKSIRFVYDGWLLMAEVDDSGDLIRSYVWGLDKAGSLQQAGGIGGLLAVVDHTGETDKVYWVTADDNGNVMELVDSDDGSKDSEYEYGPYGGGLVGDGGFAADNPLRFSTKYCDAEVGLYYYGYRYYDALNGRWISRDPIAEEGGANLTQFCKNDPINIEDPTGCNPNQFGAKDGDEVISIVRGLERKVRRNYGPYLHKHVDAFLEHQLEKVDHGSNHFYVFSQRDQRWIDMRHFIFNAQLWGWRFGIKEGTAKDIGVVGGRIVTGVYSGIHEVAQGTPGFGDDNNASYVGTEDFYSNDLGTQFGMRVLAGKMNEPGWTLSELLEEEFQRLQVGSKSASKYLNALPANEGQWQDWKIKGRGLNLVTRDGAMVDRTLASVGDSPLLNVNPPQVPPLPGPGNTSMLTEPLDMQIGGTPKPRYQPPPPPISRFLPANTSQLSEPLDVIIVERVNK